MELLNKLRVLADELYSKSNSEKYLIIKEMLEDDRCFFYISSSTALSILNDLGFSNDEALVMYEKLISPGSYKKTFESISVK